ncbi:MAG TPA: integrase arm-type DNA-binding domain-containing protein [Pseudolabrys sp.]|jgi:integrase|nr:integrase arm-type DNA-binding domain-containing protein [Pseudolabrys sp.]
MPTVALTDRFCSTAKPLKGRTDFFDVTVQGLALRVTEQGHRSWCYHYRSPRDRKRARVTIGTYPATSLAAARGKALEARGHVEAGQDPRLVLAGQAAAGMTVAALVDAYLADPEKAELRSKSEIERRLKKNVIPIIGEIKLAELRRRDLRNVTDAILKRGSRVEATRVFEDARAMVRWAVQNEYLDVNPLDGMDKPAEATSSNRVLSDDEISTLWNGLPRALSRSTQCQWIVKLALVTTQRSGEVAGMVPAELDFKAREWRLPGSRVKNGHSHIVPLSDLAINIIKEATAETGEGPVFPCGKASLSSEAVARTILRANEITKERPRGRFGIAPWSMHDLRRTGLTGMARLGVPPIILASVANHRSVTRAGVTLGVYSQYDYAKEKRAALDLWAERLGAIIGGKKRAADVVPLTRRSRA